MEQAAQTVMGGTPFLTANISKKKTGQCRVQKRLIPLFLSIFFVFFSGSAGLAQEETQETTPATTLEDLIVTETASNPTMPVITRYGTQHNVVTEEQIKEQNAPDFQSTMRNVPGVMFQSKNLMGSQTSHSLYIHGRGSSHPSADFAIEYDGAPRYGALFGQVLGDGIAVSTIGEIEIFKSPQPSEFGSGYALVNVLPRYLTEEGQEYELNFSGGSYATFNQGLSGGIKKGAFDIYLGQSWASTDGHVDHSRAQQLSGYANMGYQFNDEWNVRLLLNGVKSQTQAPMPDTTPTGTNGVNWPGAERYDTETVFATLTLNHNYKRFSGYLKAYCNETDFDLLQELNDGVRYANGTGGLWSQQEISLYGIRAKEKLTLWPGGEILAGLDFDMSELKNTQRTYSGLAVAGINSSLAERAWDYPDTTVVSPYLAVSQQVGHADTFHIIPSAGYRYFSHNEFESVSSYQAGIVAGYAHTDINFNYARGVIYPSPVVVMNAVSATSTITDPEQYWDSLDPEIVDHYEVGITHKWPELASIGATVFYDKGKDRFQAYMYGPVPLEFNDPIGSYKIRGTELTATLTPVKNLELFAGATWMEARATGSDGVEQDKMPYTPEFQFQAGLKWAFLEKFQLYLDMQHLSDLYQGTTRRTGTFNYSELGESAKLDDITLFNGRVSYRFDYPRFRLKDSEFFLAVNNIFNTDYEYAKGYEMPGTTVFAGFNLKFN